MSDAQNPVEETPAAPAAAPVEETAPAAAAAEEPTTATEAPAQETPVAATETAETAEPSADAAATTTETEAAAAPAEPETEAAAAPATSEPAQKVEEPKEIIPATDGVLGYKAPGLVKGLRFAKRYFYFSEEPVEAKNLTHFHQNEKPLFANPVAAWASQTGKGLVFFTKRAEDKATPTGILNLADMTDLSKEGVNELIFKLHGHKHTFQASSSSERDSWFAAFEAKAAEAKAEKETVTSSEGYKAELEKLTKPVIVEPAQKKPEAKKDDGATSPADDKVNIAKSRSQSRKRGSIFGTLLGKKEEGEEKKEDKLETPKPAETVAEAPAEEAATAPAEAAPASPAENGASKDDKKAEATPTAPKSKRASLFGNFFQKVTSPSHEKFDKEATAAVAEPSVVASTAPQLDNPVEDASIQPLESETVTAPAEAADAKESPAAPAETAPAAEPVASPATSPAAKEKRRTSFFGNLGVKKEKKGDASDSDVTDGEGKAKTNKFGSLFRKPGKAAKAEEKKDTAAAASEPAEQQPESVPEVEEPTTAEEPAAAPEAPVAESAEPVNVATSATPVQAAA